MSETTPASEPHGILSGLKRLIGRGGSEQEADPKKMIRTSEIRSSDGPLVVGDSMQKMRTLEDAREAGTLIEDGDAPQFTENRKQKAS